MGGKVKNIKFHNNKENLEMLAIVFSPQVDFKDQLMYEVKLKKTGHKHTYIGRKTSVGYSHTLIEKAKKKVNKLITSM